MFLLKRSFWAALALGVAAVLYLCFVALCWLAGAAIAVAILACLIVAWAFERVRSWAAFALACLFVAPAFAQATIVPAQPIVGAVAGYVMAIVAAVTPVILGLIWAEIKSLTGVSIDADVQRQIAAWATTEAEALAANLEGGLGTKSFTIASPQVAAIVRAAPSAILSLLNELGLSADDLANLVVAAIGRLQQSAAVLPAPSK